MRGVDVLGVEGETPGVVDQVGAVAAQGGQDHARDGRQLALVNRLAVLVHQRALQADALTGGQGVGMGAVEVALGGRRRVDVIRGEGLIRVSAQVAWTRDGEGQGVGDGPALDVLGENQTGQQGGAHGAGAGDAVWVRAGASDVEVVDRPGGEDGGARVPAAQALPVADGGRCLPEVVHRRRGRVVEHQVAVGVDALWARGPHHARGGGDGHRAAGLRRGVGELRAQPPRVPLVVVDPHARHLRARPEDGDGVVIVVDVREGPARAMRARREIRGIAQQDTVGDQDLLVALGQRAGPGDALVPGAVGCEEGEGQREGARRDLTDGVGLVGIGRVETARQQQQRYQGHKHQTRSNMGTHHPSRSPSGTERQARRAGVPPRRRYSDGRSARAP
jgi:hypothetical protein